MKKDKVSIIMLFVLLSIQITAQNSEIDYLNPSDLSNSLYVRVLGSWDFEAIRNDPSMDWDFSWGKGKVVREMSVIIDRGLFREPENAVFFLTGSGSFIFSSISEISEKIYKVDVQNKFKSDKSTVIIHCEIKDEIWFESIEDYNVREGSLEKSEFQGRNIINQLRTGEDNKYYKRSGPQIGISKADRVSFRNIPELNGNHLGYLRKNQFVYIIDETIEKEIYRNMESVWYKIKTIDGLEGWVYGSFIGSELSVNNIE